MWKWPYLEPIYNIAHTFGEMKIEHLNIFLQNDFK